jgi:ISXO2-like transposase domain
MGLVGGCIEPDAPATLGERIEVESTVHADESRRWDALQSAIRRSASGAYSDGEGCTNDTGSLFSRLRRAEIGVHHHIRGKYLSAYAHEMAWREDQPPFKRRAVPCAKKTPPFAVITSY